MKKKPHILIFNPDQFRADALGHLGNPASVTPNLDKLSGTDGVSFRYAFCQNPVCTPSRCSFMSGWYPHVRGHRTMYHMMAPNEPVLLKTLKNDGYFVWWGGKNDLIPGDGDLTPYCDVRYVGEMPESYNLHRDMQWRGDPDGDGYFSFYAGKLEPKEGTVTDSDWNNVNGAIELIKNPPADQPLCIYLPLSYPHPPYGVEEPWYSAIDRSQIPTRTPAPENWDLWPSMMAGIARGQGLQNWTEERWAELRAVYLGMCSRIDYQYGLIVQALKEAGMYDDTAIFVFSDHGDYTGDYGLVEKTQNTFQDCLTRVPFLIKPPSWVDVKPGIYDELVELVDFSATVEELTGIALEHTHFGKSLIPLIEGKTETHRDAVFCEGGRLHGEIECMENESNAPKDGLYYPRISLQQAEGPEHTKAVMARTREYKYVYRLYESDELYDLCADPNETINRVNDPGLSDVLIRMKERLLRFFIETGDVVPHKTDKR